MRQPVANVEMRKLQEVAQVLLELDAVQPSYRRFLENRLREQFDLEGAPIRIRLRARHDNSER